MDFDATTLVDELGLIREIAKAFLEPESLRILHNAQASLRGLSRSKTGSRWAIDDPIRTRVSHGSYATDGRGQHAVSAEIRTVWHLQRSGRGRVSVSDNVSSTISILADGNRIAEWHMDIAAMSSDPGCGLHAQVHEHDTWFPSGLDIPRIPTFIPTVGAVVEFVLGELFQKDWSQHVAGHRSNSNWRSVQLQHWTALLDWQRSVLGAGRVSPWLDLKSARCDGLSV
jgi:hypothetical protein